MFRSGFGVCLSVTDVPLGGFLVGYCRQLVSGCGATVGVPITCPGLLQPLLRKLQGISRARVEGLIETAPEFFGSLTRLVTVCHLSDLP